MYLTFFIVSYPKLAFIKQIAESEGVKTYIIKSALAAAKHAAEESLAAGTRNTAELTEVKLSAEVLEEVPD